MGIMKTLFKRRVQHKLGKIPSGAFSLDLEGRVVSSTLPQWFPAAEMRNIGGRVLAFFRNAQKAQLPLQEVNIYYPTLRVTARNLRGGALIFLLPQTLPKK
jgi:hypothetical protein